MTYPGGYVIQAPDVGAGASNVSQQVHNSDAVFCEDSVPESLALDVHRSGAVAKADLELLIVAHGGTKVQNPTERTAVLLAGDRPSVRVWRRPRRFSVDLGILFSATSPPVESETIRPWIQGR